MKPARIGTGRYVPAMEQQGRGNCYEKYCHLRKGSIMALPLRSLTHKSRVSIKLSISLPIVKTVLYNQQGPEVVSGLLLHTFGAFFVIANIVYNINILPCIVGSGL